MEEAEHKMFESKSTGRRQQRKRKEKGAIRSRTTQKYLHTIINIPIVLNFQRKTLLQILRQE